MTSFDQVPIPDSRFRDRQGTTRCAPTGSNTCNSIPDACGPDRYTRCVAFLKSVGFA